MYFLGETRSNPLSRVRWYFDGGNTWVSGACVPHADAFAARLRGQARPGNQIAVSEITNFVASEQIRVTEMLQLA